MDKAIKNPGSNDDRNQKRKIIKGREQLKKFENMADFLSDLDEDGWKQEETAKSIFSLLNGVASEKNDKNNQYLIDFNKWLLEKIKDNKGKNEVWEKVKKIYERIYGHFTVHGQKGGIGLNKRADIDAASSILLFELAGFTDDGYKDIEYVANGEAGSGLHIDTSDKLVGGIAVDEYEKEMTTQDGAKKIVKSLFGSKVFLDEHGNGPCSSTRIVYEILKVFDKIPKDKINQVKRFVEFIDIVDDLYYQACGVVHPYIERTIFGLYKSLPIRFIFDYFKDPNKTGFEYLDDNYLNQKSVNVFDMKLKKKEEKSLKMLSDEKKERMKKGYEELSKVEDDGYFLMFEDTRFIVDLGAKIKDGVELASLNGKGIIRIFPGSLDLYIYSPIKLPKNFGGFDVVNDHFVFDKKGSGKDLNELLAKFESLLERKFKETVDPGSRPNLKDEIVTRRKNEIEKVSLKTEQKKELPTILQEKISGLPELSVDDLNVGESYEGVVNNTQGNIVFVTFDKENKVRGVLHKNDVDSIELFKSIVIGDKLSVKIKEIEKNGENIKIKLILNDLIEKDLPKIKVA